MLVRSTPAVPSSLLAAAVARVCDDSRLNRAQLNPNSDNLAAELSSMPRASSSSTETVSEPKTYSIAEMPTCIKSLACSELESSPQPVHLNLRRTIAHCGGTAETPYDTSRSVMLLTGVLSGRGECTPKGVRRRNRHKAARIFHWPYRLGIWVEPICSNAPDEIAAPNFRYLVKPEKKVSNPSKTPRSKQR